MSRFPILILFLAVLCSCANSSNQEKPEADLQEVETIAHQEEEVVEINTREVLFARDFENHQVLSPEFRKFLTLLLKTAYHKDSIFLAQLIAENDPAIAEAIIRDLGEKHASTTTETTAYQVEKCSSDACFACSEQTVIAPDAEAYRVSILYTFEVGEGERAESAVYYTIVKIDGEVKVLCFLQAG